MSDFLSSVAVLPALTLFAVVALATVSLALLWEGVRRWLKTRAATRALREVARRDTEAKAGTRDHALPSILNEDPDATP